MLIGDALNVFQSVLQVEKNTNYANTRQSNAYHEEM